MTEEQPEIIGPDGQPVPVAPRETLLSDLVEQPAKVMRIGGLIRQLLGEGKAAPTHAPRRARPPPQCSDCLGRNGSSGVVADQTNLDCCEFRRFVPFVLKLCHKMNSAARVLVII